MRTSYARMRVGLGLAAVVAGSVACGLISSDVLSFTFALPDKTFTIDASRISVPQDWQGQGLTIPAAPCPALIADCCVLAGGAEADCATFGLTCAPNPAVAECEQGCCELDPAVTLSDTVNLQQEAPELQQVAANVPSFATVKLKRIYLSWYSNTLNCPTPAIEIFLGPEAAASIDDPAVRKLGTLPSIPAGQSCKAPTCSGLDVELEPDGAAVFEAFARDFRQTFKIFTDAELQFRAGEALPTGKFEATLTGTVEASAE